MAKATSRDKDATARSRAQRTPVGAKAGTVRAASASESDDEMRDDEEPQPEESAASEDVVEDVDEGNVSPESIVPVTTERGVTVASAAHAPARSAGIPEPLMANPITRFIAESYLELRKVTWPTMQQAWTMTLIVIAMSAAVAAILSAADLGLGRFLTWLLNVATGG